LIPVNPDRYACMPCTGTPMSSTAISLTPATSFSPDPTSLTELLRLTPLFETLEDHLIDDLAAITREVRLPEEAELCQQGTTPQHLHVLLEGQVALWATATDESRAAVEVVRPPGYFVLATVLTRLPYLMTAQTVSAARLLLIDIDGLHALLARDVDLANALLRAEALNFRALVRQVQDLKLRTAAQRLGCYLLALANDAESTVARFRLPFDKRLLAARLGCRQENLSRAFATLRELGVETHGSRVVLHDIPALRDFAVPDEHADPGLAFSG
jgi:CRP/FNR family transcriptional activator FtrB